MSHRSRQRLAIVGCVIVAGCVSTPVAVALDDGAFEVCATASWAEASAALERGDDDAARVALARVVRACPEFVPGHLAWIRLCRAAGEPAEGAMEEYYAGVPDRPESPVVPFVNARLDTADSRKLPLLEEAIERDHSFYFAYLDLAELWGRSDRTARQFEYLEKAVQAKPTSPEANLGLARVLVSVGRGEEAVEHFEASLRARPDDRASIEQLVRLLIYELGEVDAARGWVGHLLELAPDDAAVMMDEAALAWLGGERERAAAVYRRVLELEPRNARAALDIGNLLFGSSDRDDDQGKRVDWQRARNAYRYFLALEVYDDVHDLRDHFVSVPFRLGIIDTFLGPLPADASPSRLGDF